MGTRKRERSYNYARRGCHKQSSADLHFTRALRTYEQLCSETKMHARYMSFNIHMPCIVLGIWILSPLRRAVREVCFPEAAGAFKSTPAVEMPAAFSIAPVLLSKWSYSQPMVKRRHRSSVLLPLQQTAKHAQKLAWPLPKKKKDL